MTAHRIVISASGKHVRDDSELIAWLRQGVELSSRWEGDTDLHDVFRGVNKLAKRAGTVEGQER